MSQAELARSWHLSPTSVQRVVKPFIERGDIHAIPGRGMFVGTFVGEMPEGVTSGKSTNESLFEWIVEGIRSGRLKRGQPLPQVKAVQLQFRVGQKAVAHAYRRALESGYAVRIGKRYFVSDFRELHGFRGEQHVYVFYESNADVSRFFTQPLLGDVFQHMEQELFAYNTKLVFQAESRLPRRIHTWIERNVFPGGLVLTGITRARYNHLFPFLKPLLPHIRLNQTSVLVTGGDLQHPREVHYFCDGSIPKVIAQGVADCAQQLQQRRIAVVFDGAHDSPHSMRLAVRIAGELLARNTSAEIGIFMVSMETTTVSEALTTLFQQGAGTRAYFHALFTKRKNMPFENLLRIIHISGSMEMFLDRLPQHSLCLCLETGSARRALDVCNSRQRRIPDDIALMSCEDDPASYHLGLTMVTVDKQTLGYIMAHALLNDIPLRKSGRGFMPIPVSIHQRWTT